MQVENKIIGFIKDVFTANKQTIDEKVYALVANQGIMQGRSLYRKLGDLKWAIIPRLRQEGLQIEIHCKDQDTEQNRSYLFYEKSTLVSWEKTWMYDYEDNNQYVGRAPVSLLPKETYPNWNQPFIQALQFGKPIQAQEFGEIGKVFPSRRHAISTLSKEQVKAMKKFAQGGGGIEVPKMPSIPLPSIKQLLGFIAAMLAIYVALGTRRSW